MLRTHACGMIPYLRRHVDGNRELIGLYEEKVKKVIERMWEGWQKK